MGFIQFGKRIKHRSFDFIPRYYDQEKEELEQRLKRYRAEPSDTEMSKERIKGGFRKKYRTKDEYTSKSQKRSNTILLTVLATLVFISYLFLTRYLPKIVAMLE